MNEEPNFPTKPDGWTKITLGILATIVFVGGLVFVNVYASMGVAIAIGIVGAIALLLLKSMKGNK